MTQVHRISIAAVATVALLTLSTGASAQQASGDARFELSTFIKGLMIDKQAKAGFKGDYLYFKSVLAEVRLLSASELRAPSPERFAGDPDDYLFVYEGRMPLFVKGKRLLAENMEDKYQWVVHVAGPRAGVSDIYIRSEWPIAPTLAAGPSYLSAAGISLSPIACDKSGGSNSNYTAYYRASAPSKYPITIGITKSTGSGGIWYSYEIALYGVKASKLGKDAVLGVCEIAD